MTPRLILPRCSSASLLMALSCVMAVSLACGTPRNACAATGQLEIVTLDAETGEPFPCRMHLKTAAGRIRKVPEVPFWEDHFIIPGRLTLKLPVGDYTFEIEHGPEYKRHQGHFSMKLHGNDSKDVPMHRFVDMAANGWWAGDLDVHRPVREMELLMAAEDLHVVGLVTWPAAANKQAGQVPTATPLLRFAGNRFCHVLTGEHAVQGGTWLYHRASEPFALTSAKAEYPPLPVFADRVRQQEDGWVDAARPFAWDLPMLAAQGMIDSVQVANSHLRRQSVLAHEAGGKSRDKVLFPNVPGNARWSQAIYFHLLNCGLQIPPTAGSGSGVGPNPVGYNRVYVHLDGPMDYQAWWEGLRGGRCVVTNGPLFIPSVEGFPPGHTFVVEEGQSLDLEIGLTFSTREKVSYLEILQNGRVAHSVRLDDYAKSGRLPKLTFTESGWFLIRSVTDQQATYRFAMTAPYYVQIGGKTRISRSSAQFFLDWVYERARQIQLTDPAQQQEVIEYHRQARDFWQDLVDRANTE